MDALFTNNLLWTEGFYIIASLAIVSCIALLFYRRLLYLLIPLVLFSLYFFRNPERVCPQAVHDDQVIICPADGKIVDIQYDAHAGYEGFNYKISIFLSPLDVHVTWAPSAGVVDRVRYKPGTFTVAFLPKSSLLNERNDIDITTNSGNKLLVRQIAGTVARRICCWVTVGESIKAGHKIGMIRFGSRVDLLLPHNVALQVALGQRVYGGQTMIGRWT